MITVTKTIFSFQAYLENGNGNWVKMRKINLVHPGREPYDAYDIPWTPWGYQKLFLQCTAVNVCFRAKWPTFALCGCLKGGKYASIWFNLHP